MKRLYAFNFTVRFFFFFFLFFISLFTKAQNIAVNTTGTAAAASNLFEVTQPAGAANNYVSIFASNLSTATNAYAIWAQATGAATGKYAIVVPSGGGYVGIGTTAPASNLVITANSSPLQTAIAGTIVHVAAADGSTARLLIDGYGASPVISGRMSNGTAAAPSAATTNSVLMKVSAWGYGTSAYSSSVASMTLAASENFTNAANGTYIAFSTTSNGTINTAEKVRIDNAGNVGIGTTAPDQLLHVYNSTVARQVIGTGTTWTDPYSGFTAQNISALQILSSNTIGGGVYLGWTGTNNGDYTGSMQFMTTGTAAAEKRSGYIASTLLAASGASVTGGLVFGTTNSGTISEKMRIDNMGNVGIGTTTPDALLNLNATTNPMIHVNTGTSDVDGSLIRLTESGLFRGAFIRYESLANRLDIGVHDLNTNVTTDDLNVISIPRSTGYVGIGTINPYRKFSVVSLSGSVTPFLITTNDFNNTNTGSMFSVEFGAASGNTYTTLNALSAGGTAWNNLILQQNGSVGNVGIGTTNPLARLHILGSSQNTLAVESTAYPELTFRSSGSIYSYDGIATSPGGYFTTSGSWDRIFRAEAGNLLFGYQGNEYMRVGTNGYVGIGTAGAASQILHVRKDQSGKTRLEIQNANVGTNDVNAAAELFCQGTNNGYVTSIGVGDPNYNLTRFRGSYVYSNMAYGLVLTSENAAGPIRFFTINGGITQTENMTINPGGNVCIENGTLWVSQSITSGTGGWGGGSCASDIRFKKAITPLPNALENILKLQGVNYFWKTKEFPDRHFNDEKQIGLIAQEIEKIYPEVVRTEKDGYKSVDYSRLVPALIEAIKEQQKTISTLQTQNDIFKSDINYLKSSVDLLMKQSAKK